MVTDGPDLEMAVDDTSIPIMQIPPAVVETSTIEESINELSTIPRKNPRTRKKALHASILKQMEFYFGDANLSKDRFLSSLVKEDPYVDLDVFLMCNKIRALTTDKSRIAKALQNSTILKVSEDGMKVCRTTPILDRTNSEECTVYVQKVPTDIDHEWLSTAFSQYGSVVYVSIPKYKNCPNTRGFAFVEYEKPEDAQKCLKAFKAKGGLLPSQTSPNQLLSITTFDEDKGEKSKEVSETKNAENGDKTQEQKKKKRKNSMKNEVKDDNEQSEIKKKKKKFENDQKDTSVEPTEVKKKKKSHDNEVKDSDTEQFETKKMKKRKQFLENNKECKDEKKGTKRKNLSSIDDFNYSSRCPVHDTKECPPDKKQKKQKKRESAEVHLEKLPIEEKTDNGTNDENEMQDDSGKKKKKSRKRKNHGSYHAPPTAELGMQVMSKTDWRKLRNKYLNLQKANMKQLKQHLRRTRNHWGNSERYGNSDRNMETDCVEENIEIKKEGTGVASELVPGIIVKIEMNAPCCDPKGFKAEMKTNAGVKYIDVNEGASVAYVRCDTTESATLLSQMTNEDKSMSILKGEEEQDYWGKIKRDREEKIGNKTRVKQRGRDKLLKRAEKVLGKHIKFDEV